MSISPEATSAISVEASQLGDDKRLDRLLDYTKFHIGIYISAGGGLVALLASAATAQSPDAQLTFLKGLVVKPWALALACLLMGVAGASGGVIASCCTQCQTFDELWIRKQGPHTRKWLPGKFWALLEHSAFWSSFLLAAYSVLWSHKLKAWIFC